MVHAQRCGQLAIDDTVAIVASSFIGIGLFVASSCTREDSAH
jgi:hypothetical protein